MDIDVFYVDFGNSETVPWSHIRSLQEKFRILSRQVRRGSQVTKTFKLVIEVPESKVPKGNCLFRHVREVPYKNSLSRQVRGGSQVRKTLRQVIEVPFGVQTSE